MKKVAQDGTGRRQVICDHWFTGSDRM